MSDPLDATDYIYKMDHNDRPKTMNQNYRNFVPDPDYELIEAPRMARKKGIQCGRCGMKFDYDIAHGYYCPALDCPVQLKAR